MWPNHPQRSENALKGKIQPEAKRLSLTPFAECKSLVIRPCVKIPPEHGTYPEMGKPRPEQKKIDQPSRAP